MKWKSKFVDLKFENIVIGYSTLLKQQISSFEASLESVVRLNGLLNEN